MSGQGSPSLEFVDDPQDFSAPSHLVVRLPGRYPRKQDLFRALARGLKFPSYFGNNWDSLEECLRDLSWLKTPGRIALVHNKLPLADDDDRQIYLDILGHAQAAQQVPLRIIFPQSAKNQLGG